MNDSQLETTIKKILEDKMAASAMDINVESKDYNIHLSGMVDTLGEKAAAEKIVKTIGGVESVENNITIATDGYIPDKDIQSYVADRMTTHELSNVTPKAEGGSVTLIGHVRTYAEAERAIELAQQTMGVKDVVNNIKIESQGQFDDDQITSKITQVLDSNRIDFEDVDPIVKHDAVTLQGFVQGRYELELAEELISKVEGVKKVKNRLKTRD